MSTSIKCAWGNERPVSIFGEPTIKEETMPEVVVDTVPIVPKHDNHKKYNRNEDSTVKVNNFPDYTTEDDLFQLFSACGQVHRVNIVCDQVTGKSRGFGFVSFRRKESAEYAVKNLHRFGFHHSFLNVVLSIKK